MPAVTVTFNRDTSKDKTLGGTTSYYTHSTIPAVGMSLYNENNADTGYVVATVSSGSFTAGSIAELNINFNGTIVSFTVDNNTYTYSTYTGGAAPVRLIRGVTYTFTFVNYVNSSTQYVGLKVNGSTVSTAVNGSCTLVINNDTATFTGTSTATASISSIINLSYYTTTPNSGTTTK